MLVNELRECWGQRSLRGEKQSKAPEAFTVSLRKKGLRHFSKCKKHTSVYKCMNNTSTYTYVFMGQQREFTQRTAVSEAATHNNQIRRQRTAGRGVRGSNTKAAVSLKEYSKAFVCTKITPRRTSVLVTDSKLTSVKKCDEWKKGKKSRKTNTSVQQHI
ncbi:hypothetical protein PO909_032775 [Leuciscus waleckii]